MGLGWTGWAQAGLCWAGPGEPQPSPIQDCMRSTKVDAPTDFQVLYRKSLNLRHRLSILLLQTFHNIMQVLCKYTSIAFVV